MELFLTKCNDTMDIIKQTINPQQKASAAIFKSNSISIKSVTANVLLNMPEIVVSKYNFSSSLH